MPDGIGEKIDDLVIAPELGEVLERKIDGAPHCAGAAESNELVTLSLPARHAVMIPHHADVPLYQD